MPELTHQEAFVAFFGREPAFPIPDDINDDDRMAFGYGDVLSYRPDNISAGCTADERIRYRIGARLALGYQARQPAAATSATPSRADAPPRVEVIHDRDPDNACDVRVFIDGQQVGHTEYSIDPGAGHNRADWDETTASEVAAASPAAAAILKELRDYAAENSTYIER